MRNRAIEYPHPVLNEYTRDFVDSEFSIEVTSFGDNGSALSFDLACNLSCDGLKQLLQAGDAKVVVRLTCYRTSFRTVFDIAWSGSTVTVEKKNVADFIELEAIVVATKDISGYVLPEFNQNYFSGTQFKLRKGDILANEPGVRIKLDTILEKNMAGIVHVSCDASITEMKVHYATVEEADPALTNYIVIAFPEEEYKTYAKLRTKKHLKNGIERFLQSSLILPAITEAISKLRMEEMLEEDPDMHFKGTIWADSLYAALRNLGVEELATCTQSDFELANKILGNVETDSMNNLMQKLTDWSTLRQEDDAL